MLRYFIFYKPFQVLSQFSAEGDKKTLADFFSGIPKDVYPVGRLDYDSEGLLLLTNDKELTHRLLDPQYRHPRTYLVQVEGNVTEDALRKLRSGVTINVNGKRHLTAPAEVTALAQPPRLPERMPSVRFRKTVPDCWLQLTLTEGKNRQVRRMTAAVGLPTLRLVRYSIGAVTVEGLEPGGYQELNAAEKKQLLSRDSAGL